MSRQIRKLALEIHSVSHAERDMRLKQNPSDLTPAMDFNQCLELARSMMHTIGEVTTDLAKRGRR